MNCKTLIAYYSHSGKTRLIAESIKTQDCDIFEIKEAKKRSTLNVWTAGISKALSGKPTELEPNNIDFHKYSQVVVLCPIWAGTFAPAGATFLQNPNLKNKNIIGVAVSASGSDCNEKIKTLINSNAGLIFKKAYSIKAGDKLNIDLD